MESLSPVFVDRIVPVRSSEIVADHDRCYRAVLSRDARFDGTFFTAVRTTGIYCRPSCPTPVLPKARNVDFYPSAAAAQRAGFRACKRCRPQTLCVDSQGFAVWPGVLSAAQCDGLVESYGNADFFRSRKLLPGEFFPEAIEKNGLKGMVPVAGVMPALVPGMPEAAMVALREFGTLSLAEVIQPAIDLADGMPLDETRASTIARCG